MRPRRQPSAAFAALALLVAFPRALAAEEASKLLVLPIAYSEEKQSGLATMVEDLLVSSIVAGKSFEVSVRARNGNSLATAEEALSLANQDKAGFVLLSRLVVDEKSGGEATIALTSRLIAADTGKELFARTTRFREQKAVDSIDDLAKRLAVAARSRSDITVDLVDAFIKAKDWEAASRYLGIYSSLHPDERPKLVERVERTNAGLGEARNRQAREAAGLFLYEEALRQAREAVDLVPSQAEYKAYLASLEEEYARYVAQSDEERLDAVGSFFDDGRLDIAQVLLSRASDSARSSSRGKGLAERIDRAIKARASALEAEKYLDEYQYALALAAVDESLRLVPDTAVYIKLRARILDAEKREAATQERFAAYKEELRSFDYGSLFFSKKAIPLGFECSAGGSTVKVYDPATGSWNAVERGPLPGAGLRFTGAIPYSLPGFYSFTSIPLSWFGKLEAAAGVDRTEESSPVVLDEEKTTIVSLQGGAAISLEALSFALRLDGHLGLSWTRSALERISPYTGSLGATAEDAWTLGAGIGLDALWTPAKNFFLGLGLSWTWPLFSSLDLDNGAPRLSSVSFLVGLGRLGL